MQFSRLNEIKRWNLEQLRIINSSFKTKNVNFSLLLLNLFKIFICIEFVNYVLNYKI